MKITAVRVFELEGQVRSGQALSKDPTERQQCAGKLVAEFG